VVPLFRSSRVAFRVASSETTAPCAKAIVATCDSRHVVTSSRDASALVTLTPTPCSPPEKLYADAPPLSNLPPACRRVKTSSRTGRFSSGCRPKGMPRPSSAIETEPSAWSTTSMRAPCPPSASSAALSITSWTMCSGFSVRVYMPGRCCTGSSPLRTRMEASP
jgi:hypothetical protein